MPRIEYAKAWNFKFHRMGRPIPVDEARTRYTTGADTDWYSVGVFADTTPDGGIPEYTLEIVPGPSYISVTFYDQAYRIRFKYGFRNREDRMFLESVKSWTYPDDNVFYELNKAILIEVRTFRPDGTMHWRSTDKQTGMVEEFDAADVDVSKHWEPIPDFGHWESIARFER